MALSVLLCGFLIVLSGVQQVRSADCKTKFKNSIYYVSDI